jgi:hypothetical protein
MREGVSLNEASERAELRMLDELGVEVGARTLRREWSKDKPGLP